ncbi:hypothetical protein GCM10010145_47700 [Streptomyces ruber]|uniref:SH3 domain-containing protein n=2 Tax=Streptomyces TaxID=1883 RepID=A0A918EV29_9ACTN|nr:hypothetical protein GCM10010145_47700 [Streptomyces ruber]
MKRLFASAAAVVAIAGAGFATTTTGVSATPSAATAETSTRGPVSAMAATPSGSEASAVTCYLYVSDRFGYYNVRSAKSATAGLIVRYTGTRLPTWQNGCSSELGGTYRCATGEPQDNWWVPVNYNGRKGYVAANCAGGLGA